MDVELVAYEYPNRLRIGLDGSLDVGQEVRFCSSRPNTGADDFSSSDMKVGDESLGPVTGVFELHQFDPTWAHTLARMDRFECLNTCHFVGANCMGVKRDIKFLSLVITSANGFDGFLEAFLVLVFVLAMEPILDLMWFQMSLLEQLPDGCCANRLDNLSSYELLG